MEKVRVDKWLWAARFYKTRNLAKQAIESGKVKCDGERVKPSRELTVGLVLTLKVGWDEKTVTVVGLSEQRRGASEAQQLYVETPESIAKRELAATQRKMLSLSETASAGRPTKKQRRAIHRFHEQNFD